MSRLFKVFCLVLCAGALTLCMGARKRSVTSDQKAAPASAGAVGSAIVMMDTTAGWEQYQDAGVVYKLATVAGKSGKALEINYSMGAGGWLGLWREIPQDLSKFAGLKFSFKGEGAQNTLEIKLEDSDGSNFGMIWQGKSNSSGWMSAEVPFAQMNYMWGGDQTLDLKKVKLHFAVSKKDNDEGGTGKVVISAVEGYGAGTASTLQGKAPAPAAAAAPAKAAAPAVAMPAGVVDTMASASGWQTYQDNTVLLKVLASPDKAKPALILDYDMATGGWLGVWKEVPQDFAKYKGIKFSFKGEGGANSVEVKLEDRDGSNFGLLLADKSNKGSWTTVEVPFSQMTYFWGGNQSLDLVNPKLHFAVSKKGEEDAGGKGKLYISQVEFLK